MFDGLKKRKKGRNKRKKPTTGVLFVQGLIGLTLFCLLGGVIYGVWYVTHLPSLNISNIEVSGGNTIDAFEIEDVVEEVLSGAYYKLIPRRFAWTYPELEIKNKVKEINKVKSVSVDRVNNNTVVVDFQEYTPHALWCVSAEGSECLYLASDGQAFAIAPQLSGTTFLRYFLLNTEPSLGESPFSADLLGYIDSTNNLLKNKLSMKINNIEKTSREEASLYVAGGGELKITTRQSPEDTVENLLAVLSSDEFSHIEAGNFQYIDLRFGNKIFVNEETVSTTTEMTDSVATTTSEDVSTSTSQ